MSAETQVCCDTLGCPEKHPVEHDSLGDPGFGDGKWLGWVYLDLNRPDIANRPLRFCDLRCMDDYLHHQLTSMRLPPPGLRPERIPDELRARRMGAR